MDMKRHNGMVSRNSLQMRHSLASGGSLERMLTNLLALSVFRLTGMDPTGNPISDGSSANWNVGSKGFDDSSRVAA